LHRKDDKGENLVESENKSHYMAEPVLCECSPDEQIMIKMFRSLNEDGQIRIVDYVNDIVSVKKYHQ
jgi:hypothetical protein